MKIVAIDPGETTGWSVWDTEKFEKLHGGQTPLWEFIDNLYAGLTETELPDELRREEELALAGVEQIVCEDWRIYPEEARNGALDWDSCRTARGIGAIELIARITRTPIALQGANIKTAAKAMGAEEEFVTPRHENRHENDSAYHAVFWTVRHRTADVAN